MTPRYLLDAEIALRAAMLAIDQENGNRDAAGNWIHRDLQVINRLTGEVVYVSPAGAHPPSTACGEDRLLRGEDGTVALELDADALEHARAFGKRSVPRLRDLARARDLSGDVAVKADDRIVAMLSADVTSSTVDDPAALESRLASQEQSFLDGAKDADERALRQAAVAQDAATKAADIRIQVAAMEGEMGAARLRAALQRRDNAQSRADLEAAMGIAPKGARRVLR